MDLRDFRKVNIERCNDAFFPLDTWGPSDWGVALAGEVGELCNFIKKMNRGDADYTADIGKELADIVTYADLLAARLGLDLNDCLIKKFNEVSDRRGSSVKIKEAA